MKKISINDLPRIKNELSNYDIIYNQDGIVKFSDGNNEEVFELSDYITISNKLYMPNYNNSILYLILLAFYD